MLHMINMTMVNKDDDDGGCGDGVVVIMIITGKGPVGTRHQVVGDYDDNAAAININTDKFSKQGRDKGRSQTDHSNGCVHEGIDCFLCLQN